MFISMTGFGKAEDNFKKSKYTIEIRSINSRFCEISLKYPKYLYSKEFELKEAIRKNISRGLQYWWEKTWIFNQYDNQRFWGCADGKERHQRISRFWSTIVLHSTLQWGNG